MKIGPDFWRVVLMALVVILLGAAITAVREKFSNSPRAQRRRALRAARRARQLLLSRALADAPVRSHKEIH